MNRIPATADVVEAACAGDTLATDLLVAQAAPLVLRWCRRLGGPRVSAEDAAQDVIERALNRIHTLEKPDRFDAWLFGITRRRLADLRRLRWVQSWAPGLVVESLASDDDPERNTRMSESARRVQLALDAMPTREREVLVLFHVEERSLEEVAVLLDIPTGTVKSRLHRARHRFYLTAKRRGLAPDIAEVPR